jgi:hypothetical protein
MDSIEHCLEHADGWWDVETSFDHGLDDLDVSDDADADADVDDEQR